MQATQERAYGRDFRPMPVRPLDLTLAPLEPHGWRLAEPRREDRSERMVDYIALLAATTDAQWRYEMAEGDEYRSGAQHFAKLWALQAEVDPSGAIWRAAIPAALACGLSIPQPRVVS